MKFLHNNNRVEAFSDGVFAFAATLMVVTLDMDASLWLTGAKATNFISFGASFFVLVMLWKIHYNFFRRNSYIDNWIIALNSVLLFVVLYYVFPLKSLINSWMGLQAITRDGLASLFVMYGFGFALIFLCYALMYYRAFRKTRSIQSSIDLLFYAHHFSLYVLVAIMSIILGVLKVGINFGAPGFFYGLLGPLCYLHAVWFDKKYRNTLL
ncbi:TMEM175 family protein [uncultured Muriicola sp.]|uniref:TMEM175 family protein n=1 Tax=uncultured Muriicola sp. TaxID=1583102 RepID=UPI0026030F53|nr:TMEM175 family protein [uncultured Muriicola sp.]